MPNAKETILVLGATGFVGRNIASVLKQNFEVVQSVRYADQTDKGIIWFDLTNENSWCEIEKLSPSVIINCIGYGVVKTEKEVDKIYEINYLKTVSFFEYLSNTVPAVKIIHIGTAFEYDLSIIKLSETSSTLPLTHYGISKLMASNYLLQKKLNNRFIILRPFNMFGLYEDESKIVPYLILSQKNKIKVDLSSGLQRRDYCYVGDFAKFILTLINNQGFGQLPSCINVGTGKTYSIKELSYKIAKQLPTFDATLWNWDAIPQRKGEYHEFYNNSDLAKELGFAFDTLEINLSHTIQYYWNI